MKPEIKKDYYSTGELYQEIYKDSNGKYHREDGPAFVKYYEDGSIKYESYRINNKLHREDGPAYVSYYEDGSIRYEEYWINDKRHREDGPARVRYFENGQVKCESYYVNGKELTKEEVEELKRNKEIDEYFKNMLDE